jgi:hypothetical protein
MYTFWELFGLKDNHMIMMTSEGTEDIPLDEDIYDGSQVISKNQLTVYMIKPNSKGTGTMLTQVAINETEGAPQMLIDTFGIPCIIENELQKVRLIAGILPTSLKTEGLSDGEAF